MKNIFKQVLKAICYIILFVFNQAIVSTLFMFGYGIKRGFEQQGVSIDGEVLVQEASNFILSKSNTITLISGLLTLVFLWLFFKIRKKQLSTEAFINKFDTRKTIFLVILGFTFSLFVVKAIGLLPIPESVLGSYVESSQLLFSGSMVMTLLSTVIVAPIVEEVVFRGLVLSRLSKAMNNTAALIISSLLFAVLHGHILWMSYAFVLGIIFGIIAIRMKSIVPSIIFHMSFNLFGLFVDMIPFPQWSIAIVCLVSFVISAVVFYYIMKGSKEDMKEISESEDFNHDIKETAESKELES